MFTTLSRLIAATTVAASAHTTLAQTALPTQPPATAISNDILLPPGLISTPQPITPREPATVAAVRAASANAQAASEDPLDDYLVPKITFDLPTRTAISNQFSASHGVVFEGSSHVVIEDLHSHDSPVLSGTPDFEGDIAGTFVDPTTGEPSFVYAMTFTLGGLDELDTVLLQFFDPDGQLLFQTRNVGLDYWRATAYGGNKGIASWRFSNVSAANPDRFGLDDLIFTQPGVADLGMELGISDCSLGNPVNPAIGNKYQVEVDYTQSKPFPMTVQRSYNSLTGEWRFLPELSHIFGTGEARVIKPDGKRLTFTDMTDTQWNPVNPAVTSTLSMTRDLEGEPSGWVFRTIEGERQYYDIAGRIVRAEHRTGVAHDYQYNNTAITVNHSLSGTLVYHLDVNGNITGFTDPDGFQYGYEYNDQGLISALTYPVVLGSIRRVYEYNNTNYDDLLTGIRIISDSNNYLYASWTYDDQRRAISSTHANGVDETAFDYALIDHPDSPQTRVTNALGKETTYHFTSINGLRKTFAVQGHQSDNCLAANKVYSYYSNGFIYSSRDWNNNLTTHTRNARGQELSRTEAAGLPEERTITTAWHSDYNLPTSIEKPGQRTVLQYDTDGNLLQRRVIDTSTPD